MTAGLGWSVCADAADTDTSRPTSIELAERAESARIAVIEKVAPSVVCIFDEAERGGGSGVIISPDGYGLTNFHVVEAMMETRSGFGGLSDGKLYPLQVLGIDPGGDVAMFKLSGRDTFPYSKLGDSDLVRVGDTAIAMGNPFLLSDDYAPTVTSGIVSGIHRYQYGSGDVLLYSDCIQVDTSINPGNSGGPLFNIAGEVIGINGRISVSMRGRVNVGMGYAITSNQIKPFIPGLRAGLLVEHGTIQATVRDRDAGVVFVELYEGAPAWDVGVRPGDELVRFANQPIQSANHFASVLGTLPGDWPVALSYRDATGKVHHRTTRTEGVKIKTKKPYEPDPEVVALGVERVLKRFRRTIGKTTANPRKTWREVHTSGEAATDSVEYKVIALDDGSVSWTPSEDDSGSILVEKVDGALQASIGDAPLPAAMDLAFRARAFAHERLIKSDPEKSAGLFEHCGADALLDPDSNGVSRSTLLECITVPLDDHTTIRLGFDASHGNLRRITATDEPTRESVDLTLADASGWPVDLVVKSTLGKTAISIADRDKKTEDRVREPIRTKPNSNEPTLATEVFDGVAHRVVKLIGARVGQSEGYGCGILISTNGLVLTVDSGLLNSPNVRAHLSDGSPRKVNIVHADRELQLALVQLTPGEFVASEQGKSKYACFDLNDAPTLTIGQTVFAGGNPFKVADKGERISLSRGVYCGTTKLDATRGTQEFPYRGDVLVIDAITSAPGFAGGALVDSAGQLVGLVGRGVESRFTHTQLNYAIPISVLNEFIASAASLGNRSTKKSRDVYHGIKFFELGYRSNPVYVERVRRGSPAARARIRKDDLIIGANGRPIAKLKALQRIIDECEPGDILELTVLRGEKVKKIRIELEEAK